MLCLVDIDTSNREQAANEVCALLEVAMSRARAEVSSGKVPSLYRSGITYKPQDSRACCFRPPSEVLARGGGDCKQLTLWRIAELRESGINATPRVVWVESSEGLKVAGLKAHMLIRLPDGNCEDVSVNLGMIEP